MTSDAPDPGQEDAVPTPAAIAATEEPVELKVGLIEDDRVPAGMVCMGTYRNGRLVARSVLAPEAWAQIQEHHFFDQPLQVVLVARVAPPGLQCQLFAMVPIPEEEPDEAEEPWAASVPSSSYEALVESDGAGSEDPQVAPIPLGNIVRYARDRVHPDSLPLETADILRRIIEGGASEVVDRALVDLLGLPESEK
ncbi:MAG TPA: hypothetical protein VFS51_08930 [Gemmatimonadales bacterium]|jgi:hypothetical protein|nr:hypothetical protein [Gemmatimonadales bacterium]